MKTLSLLTLLTLASSCGSADLTPPPATPSPTMTPTPPPAASPKSDAIVGNWVDIGGNVLAFKADGSALSGHQTLSWQIDPQNNLKFTSSTIEVDSCSWEILTLGGLTTPLIVTLDLGCLKAGALKYTRGL